MCVAAPALPSKKLPIGIQNLREIREQGHYYVDKSGLAIDLLNAGKYFFLSRPRRFGKSLLVDTFKELFEGHRALFEGWPQRRAGTGRRVLSTCCGKVERRPRDAASANITWL
jgi:hypothetical protein